MNARGLKLSAMALITLHPRDRSSLLAQLDRVTALALERVISTLPAGADQLALDDVRAFACDSASLQGPVPEAVASPELPSQGAALAALIGKSPPWLQAVLEGRDSTSTSPEASTDLVALVRHEAMRALQTPASNHG